MNKILITLILIFVYFSDVVSEQAEFEERYIKTLAQTLQCSMKEGSDQIWPGFHLANQPLVFHFQNGHVYAFGLKTFSPIWEKRECGQFPFLFSAKYPNDLPPLHPFFPFESKRVFVMNLDHGNETPYLPLLTSIHERFHLHQFRFFYKERVVEAKLADYQNGDLLTWMEMEHRLLTSFLLANDQSKLHYLKDYLAISQLRRRSLHSDSIKWENHQQKMEGLADYVSVKTFQIFSTIPQFKAEEFLLEMRRRKNKDIVNAQDALKGRHYFVGAVLGWALDFCAVEHWKLKIEKEGISLQNMLENLFEMKEEEIITRCNRLRIDLDWNEIRQQIEQQMEKEKKEKEEVVQVFTELEGVVVKMGTPSGHMSAGGSHEKSYQVDRAKVLVADTSVATSQDQTWILRFHSIPLIFEEQNGDRLFKLHPQTLLYLNGNAISLQSLMEENQKELPFRSLAIHHEHCELSSQRPGKVCVEENKITFKFY